MPNRGKVKLVERVKPTINDIARHAGVSLATVDRVLNERPGVRSVTVRRVHEAVKELGYIRDTAAANLARQRIYRFVFLLPDTDEEFIDEMQQEISSQAKSLINERTHIETLRVSYLDSTEIAAALDNLPPEKIDGVAVVAPETPTVRDAVARTRERGIAVVALLTDLPSSPRNHFVGIDNNAAGQTAAKLMGSFAAENSGKILVLTSSRLARDHLERRQGFDQVMEQQFPEFEVLPTVETNDYKTLADKVLPDALTSWPDIRGVYSTASSNKGLIKSLSTETMNLVVIAHELTPTSRAALQSNLFTALISQDKGHVVRSAVRLMRSTVDAVPYNVTQERIRIEIFLKENLPIEVTTDQL